MLFARYNGPVPAPYDHVAAKDDSALEPPASPSGRLHSLDALRGFVIGSMLLVNHTWNEAVFSRQLFHVPWNDPRQGATFTDLVFPWFVFIAGCAVPLSMRFGRGCDRPWWRNLLAALGRGGCCTCWG